jgi:3-oxoacyl-[acyl-carrier-protein] synthase III
MELLRKKLKIEDEKFYRFFENVGNTVSSTIPWLLLTVIIILNIEFASIFFFSIVNIN